MSFTTKSNLFLFFSFFFLTLVLLFTQINARDSYSFGKFQRENSKDQNPNSLVPIQTNEKKEQDNQNPTFIPESENGYGLNGHETTYNNNKELNYNKYKENVNYDDSFYTPSVSQTQESYMSYGENYPKTTESNNNYENSNAYETDKRDKEAYKDYSNNVERQGMSDTRFMAKGNYYYDLDDDRNHGRFYQNHYYNYKPTGYNEKKTNFKNPYDSNQQSEMFGEEQGYQQFIP